MKKVFKRVSAILLSAVLVTGVPLAAYAEDAATGETSYTYNLDYWGDVQDSPDFYTVCKVFTSSDLGLEVKLKSPEGLYVNGDSGGGRSEGSGAAGRTRSGPGV